MQKDADLPRGVLHRCPAPRGKVQGTQEEAAREGVPATMRETGSARAHHVLQEQQLGLEVRKSCTVQRFFDFIYTGCLLSPD